MHISSSLAHILGGFAEKKAAVLGVPMAIALVDAEGGLLSFVRMDGALPVSTELSMSKAYTAAALRMSTLELGRLARPGGVLYGIQHTHAGRIVLLGGGIPLCLEGQVVGAVGISGGSVEEDIQVAESVAAAMEQMEYWVEYLIGSVPAKSLNCGRVYDLESCLRKVLEEMDCALEADTRSIICGAIAIAASLEERRN